MIFIIKNGVMEFSQGKWQGRLGEVATVQHGLASGFRNIAKRFCMKPSASCLKPGKMAIQLPG